MGAFLNGVVHVTALIFLLAGLGTERRCCYARTVWDSRTDTPYIAFLYGEEIDDGEAAHCVFCPFAVLMGREDVTPWLEHHE